VGLGATATVWLKGTLRHGTNSSGAGVVLPDLLGIAATPDFTLSGRIFLADSERGLRSH
jgi:hypothetical protein